VAQNKREQENLAKALKALQLKSQEELGTAISNRNATITDLSEKLRIGAQVKLDIEKNYQKTINDLSLQHTQVLEVYRQNCTDI
jgi:hypothetical protein